MKHETRHRTSSRAADDPEVPALQQVGLIPGLERLVPGSHDPRHPVRSRFGTFKLPVRFHGREVALIENGTLLGP